MRSLGLDGILKEEFRGRDQNVSEFFLKFKHFYKGSGINMGLIKKLGGFGSGFDCGGCRNGFCCGVGG